jgi:hypothetical protein
MSAAAGVTREEVPPGTWAFPAGTVFAKNHPSGFLGGVQGGYNWQFSNVVVLGVEGEYSWADMKGDAQTASIPIPAIVTHTTPLARLAFFMQRSCGWCALEFRLIRYHR